MKTSIKAEILLSFILMIVVSTTIQVVFGLILRGLERQINGLFGIEYLVEADRDAYQSSLALTLLLTGVTERSAEGVAKGIADVKENIEQVSTRYE